MPVSDGYFIRKDGSVAERNVFDYIRDHLGYRIELQEMTAPAVLLAGQANPVEISLINRGFSTLFNEHPVYLVLIDESGKVCHVALTDANVNDWQPGRKRATAPALRSCIRFLPTCRFRLVWQRECTASAYGFPTAPPVCSMTIVLRSVVQTAIRSGGCLLTESMASIS